MNATFTELTTQGERGKYLCGSDSVGTLNKRYILTWSWSVKETYLLVKIQTYLLPVRSFVRDTEDQYSTAIAFIPSLIC